MNLGSNFNQRKRKGEVKNKTKWKNSFGGKDYQGEKIKKKKGKIKADKISGKNVKKKL